MANRYVRLYEGPENSSIIGFSPSAIPDNYERFQRFFNDRGYDTHDYDWLGKESDKSDQEVIQKLGGVSFHYLGVRPPMSEQHINEFASWCTQNIDPGRNTGLLVDNRESQMPLEPYSGGEVITSW